ncbi:hypothetical protein K239x_30010 [Planctomycetes bacterium K23_9]|uniref:Uncharacterized protein n=2 Tax=Stieleria marina TaxID=1930275 RepID=A0A517NV53_9BACT|nr:hypothetical protein K239x_30010 [Planctomycetes bacterium K23_9]
MKRIRNIFVKTALACSLVAAVWFVGNYMRLLAEQEPVAAASSVAGRYMQPAAGEGFLAIASGEQPVPIFPFGEAHSFDIHDGELTVAKVQLNNFLGLGWQFYSFSRADP